MERYEVVTWSRDIGSDEKRDYVDLIAAVKAAKTYRRREEYAAVYDYQEKVAYVVFGNPATEVFSENIRIIPL